MKILNENKFNPEIDTDKFGERYNAKFVCETCIKGKNGWINYPSLIFYTEEAHPEGSNYMALTNDPVRGWLISDGISVTEQTMTGIIRPCADNPEWDHEIVWSKFRHDFVGDHDGNAVDGGRDYLKINGDPETVKLKIKDGKLRISNGN